MQKLSAWQIRMSSITVTAIKKWSFWMNQLKTRASLSLFSVSLFCFYGRTQSKGKLLPGVKFLFVTKLMMMVTDAPRDMDTRFPTNIGTSLPVLSMKSPNPPSYVEAVMSQAIRPQVVPPTAPPIIAGAVTRAQNIAMEIGATAEPITTPITKYTQARLTYSAEYSTLKVLYEGGRWFAVIIIFLSYFIQI